MHLDCHELSHKGGMRWGQKALLGAGNLTQLRLGHPTRVPHAYRDAEGLKMVVGAGNLTQLRLGLSARPRKLTNSIRERGR